MDCIPAPIPSPVPPFSDPDVIDSVTDPCDRGSPAAMAIRPRQALTAYPPCPRGQNRPGGPAHRWHPHQLHHNAATELRKEFGIEAARIILGHHSTAVTEIYAEKDEQEAIRTIMKVG